MTSDPIGEHKGLHLADDAHLYSAVMDLRCFHYEWEETETNKQTVMKLPLAAFEIPALALLVTSCLALPTSTDQLLRSRGVSLGGKCAAYTEGASLQYSTAVTWENMGDSSLPSKVGEFSALFQKSL